MASRRERPAARTTGLPDMALPCHLAAAPRPAFGRKSLIKGGRRQQPADIVVKSRLKAAPEVLSSQTVDFQSPCVATVLVEKSSHSSSANTNNESPDTIDTYCRLPTR